MRRHVFSFAVLAFVLFSFVSTQAQTPDAAVNHFKNGLKLTERGEIDRAIEEYSEAIALSSRLDRRKKEAPRVSISSFNGPDETLDLSSQNIRVIDPFTAHAYNNRGLLRYQQQDYLGALEDYNAALRIKPNLAAA